MPGATTPLPEERPVIDEIVAAGFEFERDAPGWGFCHLDDRALKQVKRLKSIAFLDLFEVCDDGGVTDAGLANLAGNRSLVCLRLGPGITDAGLAHLAGLVQLEELRLDSAEAVSDAGMKHLKRLKKLAVLSVQYTQVGDGGLAAVAHLAGLQELVLCHTKVTDAGLANLAGMTRLSSLALADTSVTDAGIEHPDRAKGVEEPVAGRHEDHGRGDPAASPVLRANPAAVESNVRDQEGHPRGESSVARV
jgi:hypothetical protein